MPGRMKKCPNCHRYTLAAEKCKICGEQLEHVHPPKFSLQDKYQKYRMKFFREKMHQKYPELKQQNNTD